MTDPSYLYRATVVRVIDGDTIDVTIDLGFRVNISTRLRLAHIDTPELSTKEGKAVRAFLTQLLPAGEPCTVATQKPDKYGRALADITLPDGRDLATVLLDSGLGKPYEGGAK